MLRWKRGILPGQIRTPSDHSAIIGSMPVIPHRTHPLLNQKELHQFLLNCQQTLTEPDQINLVSISLEISPVDPLAIFQEISEPHHRHFYFEKQEFPTTNEVGKSFAILALESVIDYIAAGNQRFSQVQDFIQSCLVRTINLNPLNLPFSGPHFFCSFTFFPETLTPHSCFPPATVFLPRWQISRQLDRCTFVANIVLNKTVNVKEIIEEILEKLQKISLTTYHPFSIPRYSAKFLKTLDDRHLNHYQNSVEFALRSIHHQPLQKVVLSHAIDVDYKIPFNLTDSLNNLRLLYPGCYIFSTSNGQGQTFIGASPERLISLSNQQLVTDALAGSAPRGKTATEDATFGNHLLGSEKDLREHRAVLDFIIERLSGLNLTPHFSPFPHLLQLSNIQHLRTPIYAQVSSQLHLLDILAELHPTPAVAGVPREIALEQIRNAETFDRCLYAAPLGWVDRHGNGEFAVGIRSAVIEGYRARLYAGAGIVAGSEPEKELAEIKLKFQALLKALV